MGLQTSHKNNFGLFVQLIKQVLKSPFHFFKVLNISNVRTLLFAIKNEHPSVILKNFKELLFNAKIREDGNTALFINDTLAYLKGIKAIENKKIVFMVSHEASLTGAPLIILKIAEILKSKYNVVPIFICLKFGEIFDKFEEVAPTYLVSNYKSDANITNEILEIINTVKKKYKTNNAIINSAESIKSFKPIKNSGIQNVVGLLHETGSFYPKNAWKAINKYADKIIFPANFVKKHALDNTSFDTTKIRVRGQGLLKPELLNLDKEKERAKLLNKLNLPADAKIVIGCGQTIARKGFDMFTFTAISVINRMPNAYFIWLGAAEHNDYQLWVDIDIKLAEKKDNIIFAGQINDVSTYFAGADLFFMTSRGDPYPCVVQEAMACSLPVLGFKNAGGFVDLINDENGKILNYGDINEATNTIVELFEQPSLLNEKSFKAKEKIIDGYQYETYVDYIWELLM